MKADNPFSSKLYHHTLPVREEVWTSIEKRLPPTDDKKRLPLFWLVLFASTLFSGALMFGWLSGQAETTPQTPPAPPITLSTVPSSNLDEATITKNEPPTSMVQDEADENLLSSSSGPELSSTQAAAQNTRNISNSNHSLSSSNHTPQSSAGNQTRHTSKNRSSGTVQLQPEAATIDQLNETSTSSNHGANRSAITYSNSTSLLPLADIEQLDKPRVDVIGLRKFKPDPNCYRFAGLTGNYYVSMDMFAGPGISPRTFTYTGGERDYIEARKRTERNQYAWSAGARINLQLQSGIGFRLGIMYDQAGDVFDYTDTLATQSTTRVDSFFSADGTFLYSDTSRILIFGTLIKQIHNTYRHLDVPLLVSYELPLGRSTLMLNAGPVFNLSASYEGQILDPQLHPRTITRGAQNELNAYKTSLGLSFYLGAGGIFPLNDHFSALVEPRYLYRIKPVTIKSYPLEEHRHFLGLNLGLRYFLD